MGGDSPPPIHEQALWLAQELERAREEIRLLRAEIKELRDAYEDPEEYRYERGVEG
jgi:hypothetical protein